MKKLHKFIINIFILPCFTLAITVLLCLYSGRAWGEGGCGLQQIIMPPAQDRVKPITSGVYGPFSGHYSSTMFFGGEVCRLMKNNADYFQVICFPLRNNSGMRLAQTDEIKTIQAQLAAVDSPDGTPMPELIINFSLADMDQKFFTRNITKRLLNKISIFDEPCKLSYKLDGQPEINEEWRCSSFLNYFDKYTGQPKLYYELRARPVALRSSSEKAAAEEGEDGGRDWFKFFQSIHGHKEFKIKLNLDGESIIESALNFTVSDKWIDKLLAVFYTGKYQQGPDKTKVTEKIFGPFDSFACKENRYVNYFSHTDDKRLYKDIFLVDCNRKIMNVEGEAPAEDDGPTWRYRILDYDVMKGAKVDMDKVGIDFDLNFNFQGFESPSFTSITGWDNSIVVLTMLRYPLTQMKEDFFNSRLVSDTLNGLVQVGAPCTVSYAIDGEMVSSERFKCSSSYNILMDGIGVEIKVDYGIGKCFQAGDDFCQKAAIIKATSFLKNIKKDSREIVMEIKFDGGETITAALDLSKIDFEVINRLFKRLQTFE